MKCKLQQSKQKTTIIGTGNVTFVFNCGAWSSRMHWFVNKTAAEGRDLMANSLPCILLFEFAGTFKWRWPPSGGNARKYGEGGLWMGVFEMECDNIVIWIWWSELAFFHLISQPKERFLLRTL